MPTPLVCCDASAPPVVSASPESMFGSRSSWCTRQWPTCRVMFTPSIDPLVIGAEGAARRVDGLLAGLAAAHVSTVHGNRRHPLQHDPRITRRRDACMDSRSKVVCGLSSSCHRLGSRPTLRPTSSTSPRPASRSPRVEADRSAWMSCSRRAEPLTRTGPCRGRIGRSGAR